MTIVLISISGWAEEEEWIPSGPEISQGPGVLAIDPHHPSTLYAGYSMNGLYKSLDRGDTWQTVWEPHPGVSTDRSISDIVIDPHHANTLFVGVFAGTSDVVGGVEQTT
jgi:hypothetical protein